MTEEVFCKYQEFRSEILLVVIPTLIKTVLPSKSISENLLLVPISDVVLKSQR